MTLAHPPSAESTTNRCCYNPILRVDLPLLSTQPLQKHFGQLVATRLGTMVASEGLHMLGRVLTITTQTLEPTRALIRTELRVTIELPTLSLHHTSSGPPGPSPVDLLPLPRLPILRVLEK